MKGGRNLQRLLVFILSSAFASLQDEKGLFKSPPDCTLACQFNITWKGISENEYNVEVYGKDVAAGGYIAFGLPTSSTMRPAPVVVCSAALSNKTAVYWNTASYSSAPIKSVSEGLVGLQHLNENNGLYCSLQIKALFSFVSGDDSNHTFDLNNESYNIIMAQGAVTAGVVQKHVSKVKSTDKFTWGDNNDFKPTRNFSCTSDKGCFQYPDGCKTNCSFGLSWKGISENEYNVEVYGKDVAVGGYIAFGLPTSSTMGPAPIVVCSATLPNKTSVYWNTASYSSSPAKSVSEGLVSLQHLTEDNGLYCNLQINAQFSVLSSDGTNHTFDLNKDSYNIIMAQGLISAGVVQKHSSPGGRVKSPNQFKWGDENPFISNEDYKDCGSNIGCVGIPQACEKYQNCSILLRWFGDSQDQYNFTVLGTVKENAYLAVGLSLDNLMGNDSVIACSVGGGVNMYWNLPTKQSILLPNTTVGIQNETVSVSDSKLTCSFLLDSKLSISIPGTHAVQQFDLNTMQYYLLFATGLVNSSNVIQKHSISASTLTGLDISKYNDHNSQDIYDQCFDDKGCFGTPANCIQSKSCKIVATFSKLSDKLFEFEIGYPTSQPSSYAALALSNDDSMGDDSVMACIMNNGKFNVNLYWNTGSPKNSLISKDSHQGLSQISGSYQSGFVKCTFQRDAITNVSKSDGGFEVFDILMKKYFLLIATGNTDSNGIIQVHSIRDFTGTSQDLGSYGPVQNASKILVKLHGIGMILAWVFFANLGIFMACYFKKNFQVLFLDINFEQNIINIFFSRTRSC